MAELTIEGRNIALRERGTGSTVICLHSSSSHSGQFKPLIEALCSDHSVVAPDMHGYGRSASLPRDGLPWFVHDLKIVEALLERESGKVHLVGHSLGGALSCMAALKWPDRIASLTMIEPVLFMFLEQARHPLRVEGHWATTMVHGNLMLNRKADAARSFMNFWSGPGAYEAAPEHVQSYVMETVDRVADDWAGMVAVPPEAPSLDDLSRLNMPCQLICGGKTRDSARAIVDLLVDRVPNAQFVEISDAAHMAAATHPELVNPYILNFVREHSSAN